MKFKIAGLSKTRHSGPPREVIYRAFPECPNVCPVETLQIYERRTSPLRKDGVTALLIACVKHHKPVATSPISRWIQSMLWDAGVFENAHSTRSASTSAAFAAGMSVKDIMDTANWSRESTFVRFYHRPMKSTESFSNSVLQGT